MGRFCLPGRHAGNHPRCKPQNLFGMVAQLKGYGIAAGYNIERYTVLPIIPKGIRMKATTAKFGFLPRKNNYTLLASPGNVFSELKGTLRGGNVGCLTFCKISATAFRKFVCPDLFKHLKMIPRPADTICYGYMLVIK